MKFELLLHILIGFNKLWRTVMCVCVRESSSVFVHKQFWMWIPSSSLSLPLPLWLLTFFVLELLLMFSLPTNFGDILKVTMLKQLEYFGTLFVCWLGEFINRLVICWTQQKLFKYFLSYSNQTTQIIVFWYCFVEMKSSNCIYERVSLKDNPYVF